MLLTNECIKLVNICEILRIVLGTPSLIFIIIKSAKSNASS